MILVRFGETFRERMPEWIMSAGLIGWGLIALQSDGLFDRRYYEPLADIAGQSVWGGAALFVGLARLVFLIINGAWRPSAHLRAIGCGLSCLFWAQILVGALNVEFLATGVATSAVFLILDGLSLYFAAGDAKLADIAARRSRKHGGA